MCFSSGLLAAYYGPDWPEITALLAWENDYMHLLAKKGFTSANGHPFSRETIRLMLSNKTYVGLIEYKGNEVYQGKHEPIISVDLWDKVQKIRNEFE